MPHFRAVFHVEHQVFGEEILFKAMFHAEHLFGRRFEFCSVPRGTIFGDLSRNLGALKRELILISHFNVKKIIIFDLSTVELLSFSTSHRNTYR
jgi:hypothetical protein